MYFVLTAQPLSDTGVADLDHSVEEHGVSISETFMHMANTIMDHDHTQACGAWDLTLEVRSS